MSWIWFGILTLLTDPKAIVEHYLRHPEVAIKNGTRQDFAASTRVFVNYEQNPYPPDASAAETSAQAQLTHDDLLRRLWRIREKLKENKHKDERY